MTVDSCRPERSRRSRRRETDAKAPTLGKNATSSHSPTTAEHQKASVANIIIKHAKPLFFRNVLNCNVEGWGSWGHGKIDRF